MENLNLALVSSPKPLLLGHPSSSDVFRRTKPFAFRRVFVTAAASKSHQNLISVQEKRIVQHFASISSTTSQDTTSIGVNPQLSPSPPSTVGSPLFWIGVGVGFSALFSWVAGRLKKYAMQQAFKTLMGQANSQNNPFDSPAFSPGSPFPFQMPSPSGPATPASSRGTQSQATTASQSTVTVDIPATKVEASPATNVKEEVEVKNEPKKTAFVDVSPEETFPKSPFESYKDVEESSTFKEAQAPAEASQNGAPSNKGFGDSPGSESTRKSVFSVEALEKMMEDPTVQKMVYPYLPEEMRNPSTFKWMLQNPEYRQQLEEMLNTSGSSEWDSRIMDNLKQFDINSPDVKQKFDEIGLSPEEVVSKIMANPDVARAFQNPRVQAAIMDCSQNPLNISKYQNDKEVMDVFNKISELFPGVSGSPF